MPRVPRLFNVLPDGKTPIKLSREWLTDVMDASDDTEVRHAVREAPVRILEYTALAMDNTEGGRWRSLWWGGSDPDDVIEEPEDDTDDPLRYLVPLWPKWAEPTEIDGNDIAVENIGQFVAGAKAVLWVDETTWEVVEIDTASETGITTVDPVVGDFLIGAVKLIPLMVAWLEPVQLTEENDEIESIPLVFIEEFQGIAGIDLSVTGETDPGIDSLYIYVLDAKSPYGPQRFNVIAVAKDADGVTIPNIRVMWSMDVGDAILIPAPDGVSASVGIFIGAENTQVVKAEVGAVSTTKQVWV